MSLRSIAVAGARLSYRLDGPESAPLLVLGNSLGTSLSLWDGQLAAFSQHFRVLRYDMRGHGASSTSSQPVDIACLGRDVLALLDEIGARAACFCGLSLGGMVGIWLGAHAPERLQKLVLSNTAAELGPPAFWDERIAAVQSGGLGAVAETVVARWFSAEFSGQRPDVVQFFRQGLEASTPTGYIAACRAVRDMQQTRDLPAIQTPTLVLVGTHDRATPPEIGRTLASALANARLVELDAAHLANVEAKTAFNDAVLQFLLAEEKRDG